MPYPTYSIATDTANAALAASKLHQEIANAGPYTPTFSGVSVDGDTVTVHFSADPPAGEKTTIDNTVAAHAAVTFAEYKAAKIAAIDKRTSELVDLGFTYATKQFSLSIPSQSKMTAAHQIKSEGAFVYPVVWNTIDDGDTYSIPDATDMGAFYMTAIGAVRARLDSGTGLKDSVRAAANIAAVDAVVDNR